jgi:hypothetical protein
MLAKRPTIVVISWFIIITGYDISSAQTCATKTLQFGLLLPNQTLSIDKYSTQALCYNSGSLITGTYRVSISLPTTMSNGSSSIPVSFGTLDGVYWYNRTSWIGPIEYNPANTFTTQNSSRNIVLRLGATAQVPANASPGYYTGPVVITLQRIGT